MSESQELFERVGNLVAMAAADGRVGKRELRLLQALCDQWGVPAGVLEELVADAREGGARLSVPRGLEERKLLLKGLVQVAAVDGVIDPGEQQMLEAFADRVGLERAALERIVQSTLSKRADEIRKKKARKRAASDRLAAGGAVGSPVGGAVASESGAGVAEAPDAAPADKLSPLMLAEESLPRSERAPRRAAQAPRRAPLDQPPPQRAVPAGELAEDVSLDSSLPEVFGEVPWGSRIGQLVRCATCTEKVPERFATCPFCEGPTRKRAQLDLPVVDFSSTNTRIGLGLLAIALVLIGPYLYGSHLAGKEVDSAQHFLEIVSNPSPEDLEEAKLVEQERQAKLKEEIAKVREQLKARGSNEEADQLRDLLDRLGDGSSLTQARAQREAEFRKRFPGAPR